MITEMQLEGYSVARACDLARIARAGFYRQWEQKAPRQLETALRDAMQRVALWNRCYGYRRVTAALQQQGWQVNHKRIARMLREDNLLSLRRRTFVATTDSRHGYTIHPNLARHMVLSAPNQLWVADITYIRLADVFVYLAVILDAFSRRVVGWELGPGLGADLVLSALRKALSARTLTGDIVHHSDRGVQYCCGEYVKLLQEHGFTISMSRRGNPWDNAKCESFMKTLKVEEVYLKQYRDIDDAQANLSVFLDEVYNGQRLHSALQYQSPEAFELAFTPPTGAARNEATA
ncbi:MAG: IS3 family transposase [Bryobacteraceae bacterium]